MFQDCHCLIKEKLSYPYEFFRGSKFGHAIAYAKWSADGVRDFGALWVLFLSAFVAWPHQPHRECDSAQILGRGLMWSWPRCASRTRRSVRSKKLLSICRGSKLTTNQKRQIKLQAVLCPGWIQVGIIRHTRLVVTSGNTCGKHMETMTHLLWVVAIDTCVYTWREDKHWTQWVLLTWGRIWASLGDKTYFDFFLKRPCGVPLPDWGKNT